VGDKQNSSMHPRELFCTGRSNFVSISPISIIIEISFKKGEKEDLKTLLKNPKNWRESFRIRHFS